MKIGSHFYVSKSQRNGIFIFTLLVLVAHGLWWWQPWLAESPSYPELPPERQMAYEEWLCDMDSLRQMALARKADTTFVIYPFYASALTDFRAFLLGLPVSSTDSLLAFTAAGGTFRSANHFQKVGHVSDSLMECILAYLRFPSESRPRNFVPPVSVGSDLNSVSTEELMKVYGIGPTLAERIVRYRDHLGGFAEASQLEEVYGLTAETARAVLRRHQLENPFQPVRRDVNQISLKELSGLPYMNPSLAAKVIALRTRLGRLDSLGELTKIEEVNDGNLKRIQLYLEVK